MALRITPLRLGAVPFMAVLGLGLALGVGVAGCGGPQLARDGTFTFQQKGAHGAAVLTANGVEYHDNTEVPVPVVHRTADEPWRAPMGFILPKDGRFTKTSSPTVLTTPGLSIVLRPSDTRVPAWGGEVLVRVDVIAPAAEGTARWGENVAIVIDGEAEDIPDLADTALGQLAGRDRVTILDARGARVVVPSMPASHRSMAIAALRNHLHADTRGGRDFRAAMALAKTAIASNEVTQRVLVLSDKALAKADVEAVSELASRGVQTGAVVAGPLDDNTPDRMAEVREAVPQAGMTTFRDVRLTFEGTPAPSHVIEASGGESRWKLDAGELVLGNVRAGESRTEVLRVTVPAWVPGEKFHFTVTAAADDLAWGGPRDFRAEVPCVYDDDIERIAKSRHGDVIAYASAMATLRRLDQAFAGGDVSRAGGLRKIAEMHAESMKLLARDTKDFAIQEQADLLVAILGATK